MMVISEIAGTFIVPLLSQDEYSYILHSDITHIITKQALENAIDTKNLIIDFSVEHRISNYGQYAHVVIISEKFIGRELKVTLENLYNDNRIKVESDLGFIYLIQ